MSLRFDATMKSLVASHPRDFAGAFGLSGDGPATLLNVDLSTITAATDIAFGLGDPMSGIIDLNFQSGPDPDLPARLNVYNAVLHFRYRVPVRSVLVLLRPKADAANITGNLTFGDEVHRLEFRYGVIRMWRLPVEPFLHGGLGLLPLATLCQVSTETAIEEELAKVIRQILDRLGREAPEEEARRLSTAAFILAGLRIERDDLIKIYRGVSTMAEMCAIDSFLEEGRIDGYVRMLLRQGKTRFGEFDRGIEQSIRDISDVDRLERMIDAVLTATSWKELLETP